MKKYCIYLSVLVLVALFGAACEDEEVVEAEPLESSSVGGAELETGYDFDEDELEIIDVQTTFEPNRDFYFMFSNNQPIGEDSVVVELIDAADDQVLAEENYDTEEETEKVYDKIWFSRPGRYKIVVHVGDEERAMQELIIKEKEQN